MLNLPQLELRMQIQYPTQISNSTQKKRKQNIDAIWQTIDTAKSENSLTYQNIEEQLILFNTTAGEQVAIQYPGKESIETGDKERPYDFRPKIITSEGVILRDLVFADMWSLVEGIHSSHSDMLKTLAALFFQLGRMTSHDMITEDYNYNVIDSSDTVVQSGFRTLTWNKLYIDTDILESLNTFIPYIPIDKDCSISFEAFLYFFDMILQNEDSKYFYKKNNLSSGRIQTSDSMLLLVSYFTGHTSLSTLLQRYVSGFGVGKCQIQEIEPATGNLVHLVNRKNDLIEKLENANIAYRKNAIISVDGVKITVSLKTATPKIAVLSEMNNTNKGLLESKGWLVFDFDSALDESYYNNLLMQYHL